MERIALVKFLQEFGDKLMENPDWEPIPGKPAKCWEQFDKVSNIFFAWQKTVKNYATQASLEDLQEVKDSLKKLLIKDGKYGEDPVHEAAKNGDVKLMEFLMKGYGQTAMHWACRNGNTETVQLIIQSSKDFGIDLNAKDNSGDTAWIEACLHGKTETAQLIIQHSKDFDIDLNAKGRCGMTAMHEACLCDKTETAQLIIKSSKKFGIDLNARDNRGWTAFAIACWGHNSWWPYTNTVKMMLKNWKEFGIDIKAPNNRGETILDIINHSDGTQEIKKMLGEEYYKMINVTES